jgi:hypothetical protein
VSEKSNKLGEFIQSRRSQHPSMVNYVKKQNQREEKGFDSESFASTPTDL